MDEQQQRRGREGSKSPAPARPARARDAVIATTLEPEWPYSANPSSPARSAGIERRSRCRPTPASSSTSARAAANACNLGAAIAACSALSGTCRARRSRAPADRVELDDAEGRVAPRPRLPRRTTSRSACRDDSFSRIATVVDRRSPAPTTSQSSRLPLRDPPTRRHRRRVGRRRRQSSEASGSRRRAQETGHSLRRRNPAVLSWDIGWTTRKDCHSPAFRRLAHERYWVVHKPRSGAASHAEGPPLPASAGRSGKVPGTPDDCPVNDSRGTDFYEAPTGAQQSHRRPAIPAAPSVADELEKHGLRRRGVLTGAESASQGLQHKACAEPTHGATAPIVCVARPFRALVSVAATTRTRWPGNRRPTPPAQWSWCATACSCSWTSDRALVAATSRRTSSRGLFSCSTTARCPRPRPPAAPRHEVQVDGLRGTR